ncbi:MAG: TMEM175 family protein [Steroidobacteraceae bacterium]
MPKNRLEAFSDGVIAILITIMVLELEVPHEPTVAALAPLWPVLACYVMSFVYLGIYWNNHHHLLHAARHVNGATLWANAHLLFWLSLVPFVTAWMGENHFASIPVAAYGGVLLMCAIAYTILVRVLLKLEGRDSFLAHAIGSDRKGNASLLLYALGIVVACKLPLVACALYVTVAIIWLVPDRRIEKRLEH